MSTREDARLPYPEIATRRAGSQDSSGPILVLGNSLGTDTTEWDAVLPLLPPHVRVLLWDLPGHGESPAATEPFMIPDLADAVLAAVEENFDEGTAFVYAGDSVSGQVGFELASRNLSTVLAALPVCSAPRISTPDAWADRSALVREKGLEPLVEGTRERWFGPGFVDANPEIVNGMLERLVSFDPESYALICGALARFDAWAALPQTDTRLHVVLGSADAAVPVENARTVEDKAGNAVVTVLEGVGHQAPVEQPERTAELITAEIERALA